MGNVYASVKRNAPPGSDGVTTLKHGDKTAIVFMGIKGGHVTHIVDDKNMCVVNIADSDHVFYSGLFIRSVAKDGGTLFVSSFAEGVNRPALVWLPDALSKAESIITGSGIQTSRKRYSGRRFEAKPAGDNKSCSNN